MKREIISWFILDHHEYIIGYWPINMQEYPIVILIAKINISHLRQPVLQAISYASQSPPWCSPWSDTVRSKWLEGDNPGVRMPFHLGGRSIRMARANAS